MKLTTPFFSYFGAKWGGGRRAIYPPPAYDTIIEPFAGSAGYAAQWPEKRVILIEKNPIIVDIWNYLINVSEEELINLPDVPREKGFLYADLGLSEVETNFISLNINKASVGGNVQVTGWYAKINNDKAAYIWGAKRRHQIASQLKHIRHWKVVLGSYEDFEHNEPATWFVDPPYQVGGVHYKFGKNSVDYKYLGNWCRSRQGQVIVCESDQAVWLPFIIVGSFAGANLGGGRKEALWLNDDPGNKYAKLELRQEQLGLFK